MATTPTYAWPTPDDDDNVADGAAAIRALGNAADAALAGLAAALAALDLDGLADVVVAGGATGDVLTQLVDGSFAMQALPSGGAPISGAAEVLAAESTTASSYTNLVTVGPSVTIDVPASGVVDVDFGARITNTSGAESRIGVALTGANTIAANDGDILAVAGASSSAVAELSHRIRYTGLTAGSTTFTLKYATLANTATFTRRRLVVVTWP